MEYVFHLTSLDPDALLPQVSRALEQRHQLLGRKQYPRLWKGIDRLNAVEKAPEETLQKRRRRRKFWSLLCLALGIFLFVPGLMEPRELLVPLLVGALGIVSGISGLWQSRKKKLRENPFLQPAKQLLAEKDTIPEGQYTVIFSPEGMTITEEIVPYSDFEYIIEAEDLLLLTFSGRVTLLQKRDLITGTIEDLRGFLSPRTTWFDLSESTGLLYS